MPTRLTCRRLVWLCTGFLLGVFSLLGNVAHAQEATSPPLNRYFNPMPMERRYTQPEILSMQPALAAAAPLFPDSELIVFQSFQNEADWNVYALNSRNEWIQLTSEPSHEIHPRLNRGASKVVFSSDRTGSYELYLLTLDGMGLVQLTATGSSNVEPAWSMDGGRIAFQSYRDGQSEIYVMDADGSNQQRLTVSAAYEGQPSWSPDGSRIAYASDVGGSPQIWIMNADGSNAYPLTVGFGLQPTWSPDGGRIAYAGDANGDGWYELWYVNTDGTNMGQASIYLPGQQDLIPQGWSPDGQQIAYTRISYVYYEDEWYWTAAALEVYTLSAYQSFEIPSKSTEWNPDWQTYDILSPTSDLFPLPQISPAVFSLSWSGSDGEGDVADYQLQMRQNEAEPWVNLPLESALTQTTFTGEGGHSYYFRLRARDRVYNWEPWSPSYDTMTTIESWPPQSEWETVPRYLRQKKFYLYWSATDPGGSGVANYDVQMRRLPDTIWSDLVSGWDGQHAEFEGEWGATYEFRLRAKDRAGNQEQWSEEVITTTFYSWKVSGFVVDNAGTPVTGATITVTPTHLALEEMLGGGYVAYVADPIMNNINVSWQKDGYGNLPSATYAPPESVQCNVVLPPTNNLLTNSHFEAQNLGGGWQSIGDLMPTLRQGVAHTGQTSAMLGCQSWGSNAQLPAGHSLTVQVVLDNMDTVHFTWGEFGSNAIFYRYRMVGGSWSAPETVGASTALDERKMLIDSSQTVHFLWPDKQGQFSQIYYRNRSAAGVWSIPEVISLPQVHNGRLNMAVDGSGRLHVVWAESSNILRVVYASRSPSGEWSLPTAISDDLDPNRTMLPIPFEILISQSGAVHAVWYEKMTDGNTHRVMYRRIPSNGIEGSPQVVRELAALYEPQYHVVSVGDSLHVVWREDHQMGYIWPSRIFYRMLDGKGNWSNMQQISPFGYFISDFAGSPNGDLALTMVKQDTAQQFLLEKGVQGWTQPVQFSSSNSAYEKADIAFDNMGNLHILWTESHTGDRGGPYLEERLIVYQQKGTDGDLGPAQILLTSEKMTRHDGILIGALGDIHVGWHIEGEGSYLLGPATSPGGVSSLAQTLTIPADMQSPTLSFLYWAEGLHPSKDSRFAVTVRDASSSITLTTVSANSGGWAHEWFDLSAWQDRPITVTLSLSQTAGYPCASVLLDEVTLGSAYPDGWINGYGVTAAMPGMPVSYTLSYGNRGGGRGTATVSAVLPAGIRFVSAAPAPDVNKSTLTWQVGDLPPNAQSQTIVINGTVDSGAALMQDQKLTASIAFSTTEAEKANNQVDILTFIGRRLFLPMVARP